MSNTEYQYFRLPLKFKVFKILILSLLQIYLLSSFGYALYELISFKRLLDIIILGTLGGIIVLVSIYDVHKKLKYWKYNYDCYFGDFEERFDHRKKRIKPCY